MTKKELQEELKTLRAVNKALKQQIASQGQYIIDLKDRVQTLFGRTID